MKFSQAWLLGELTAPSISTKELSQQLTALGLEVDSIDPVAGEFSKVVVGEVADVSAHPDAKKLQCCRVNVGGTELLDIVCGAKNVRAGLKVAVAMVGAKLPGDLVIKEAKLRGAPSFGMLCSDKKWDGAYINAVKPYSNVYSTTFSDYLGESGLLHVDGKETPVSPITVTISRTGVLNSPNK